MKDSEFRVISTEKLTPTVYRTVFSGDTSEITAPGQFVNVRLDGFFLRRPISVCDIEKDRLTLVYRAVGKGTGLLSRSEPGDSFDILTGLGNGYCLSAAGDRPLLIGGGAGVPPLFFAAKKLREKGVPVTAVLGFSDAAEVFLAEEFRALGCEVRITTVDGSAGIRGFVTDALPEGYTYFYACGPLPMLKAVFRAAATDGEFSLEERMGCGFGACMGCSIMTASGPKRICRDGPVFKKSDLLWDRE